MSRRPAALTGSAPASNYLPRGAIEKVRTMRDSLPCRSLTDTVSLPCRNSVIGLVSFSSHTPWAVS